MTVARLLAIVAVLVAGAVTVSGGWLVTYWFGKEKTEQRASAESLRTPAGPSAQKEKTEAKAAVKAKDPGDLGFDVVRIGPNEPSVFAGRAPPDSTVSITANGKEVTTTKANEEGQWVALPEGEFRPGNYDITLEAKVARPDSGTETKSKSYKVAVAGPSVPPPSKSAPVTERTATPRELAKPGPITFHYNEATFTREGEATARALAEYVRTKGFALIELTGHADERGSRSHNMALSQQRAEAVAQYLKQNGYRGQFNLIAVGESQPYTAIDRTGLPKESVFQYDRRVELRTTQ